MIKRIDPTLLLLFVGMLVYTALLIYVKHFFKDGSDVFTVVSNIVSGFVASFFTRMNPKSDQKAGESSIEITKTETPPPVV